MNIPQRVIKPILVFETNKIDASIETNEEMYREGIYELMHEQY